MRRRVEFVLGLAALVGCGHLANGGSLKSPSMTGPTTSAAVLTVMCEYGAPSQEPAPSTTRAMQSILRSKKVEIAQPTEAADRTEVCVAYGGGAAALEPGFEVPAPVVSVVKKTAAASATPAVLVNVAAFEQPCDDAYKGCGVGVFGAKVREVLFSADGKVLWTRWGFVRDDEGAAKDAYAAILADVPANGLVTAHDVLPPSPPAPAAPPPETAATLLAHLGGSNACTSYAKLVCDRASLDECREAVALASAQPSPAARCKALTKNLRSRKIATR